MATFIAPTGPVETAIPEVPVTEARPPWNPLSTGKLVNPGTARANLAATLEQPAGTQQGDWAQAHREQTVLQQHVGFFDPDGDGYVWPADTFRGFRALGFNVLFSLVSAVVIHAVFSWVTMGTPDPCFRLCLANIHRGKHGSDSGAYDNEGRFIPQKFEDFWSKYADGKDGMTVRELVAGLSGQRLYMDPFGAFAAFAEWQAVYLLLWPEDGVIRKEDVRGIFDGSLFAKIAAKRAGKPAGPSYTAVLSGERYSD